MAFIQATARYLPDTIVTNAALVQFPQAAHALIAAKTGILERRHATAQCTSDLGAAAVDRLLAKSSVSPGSVQALICATSSPDRIQPATATRIQQLCGLSKAFAFDVNSVCSGAVYALRLAAALIHDGLTHVVVVSAELYSKLLNPKDIATFPYFGDGAGAALVSNRGDYELCDFFLASDGAGADVIRIPAGGTMLPASQVTRPGDFYFTMIGREVFDFACQRGTEVLALLERRNGIRPDRVVAHQASINIISQLAARSRLPLDRFHVNLDRYGNTAGASVLIGLDEVLDSHPADRHLFLVVFGGGLSWGGAYLRATAEAGGDRGA